MLLQPRQDLQGVLVYRGNVLVRRAFELDCLGKRAASRAEPVSAFERNGIVSVYKKLSCTVL